MESSNSCFVLYKSFNNTDVLPTMGLALMDFLHYTNQPLRKVFHMESSYLQGLFLGLLPVREQANLSIDR